MLRGYRLRTNYFSQAHRAGAANIEPAKGHIVEGIVIEITPAVLDVLRIKEGWPRCYAEAEVLVDVRTVPGQDHDHIRAELAENTWARSRSPTTFAQ